ncbi:carbamate kinase [Candidatus Woesearchaeota archaeon]|nr:MAG: carbamate kinase [Candidatus Woesearchaeota archaeon]
MTTIVVALGGNALLKKGQKFTIKDSFKNISPALDSIIPLIKKGFNVVITHGNGPQVGNQLIRVEHSINKAYYLPLYVCGAQTQGEIGYMIQQCLLNKLKENNIKKNAVCVLTQVLVDKNDLSFKKPTKPIGPFYTKEQLKELGKEDWNLIEDAGRGYRRVVASPKPKEIIEKDIIKKLVESGTIVIAVGGGGIPVYLNEENELRGISAVIDKDLASACLANELKAEMLLILTDVECVFLNYGKENEEKISRINVAQAELYLNQGHFAEGSMKPKVEAAISFLKKGGEKAIITNLESVEEALQGEKGTIITK